MPQYAVWEKEYRNPELTSGSLEPQNDFKRFLKWLKKTQKVNTENLTALDLGSGNGKNSIFLAERGAKVFGLEISDTAIKMAKDFAIQKGVLGKSVNEIEFGQVIFIKADIGSPSPFEKESFDLAIDFLSSNSLDDQGRQIYLSETKRVLKAKGFFFLRTLALDDDKHAQYLIQNFPGKEKNTYIMPKMNLVEKVFSKQELLETYEKDFEILKLENKTSLTKFQGKFYKRHYWVAYLQKK